MIVAKTPLSFREEDLKDFAEWLQNARKSRGLTQDALADLAEVDQALISKYERAVLTCPRPTIYALAKALSGSSEDEHVTHALLNAGLRAAGFAENDRIPVEYQPVLDELRAAAYTGDFDTDTVTEIAEYIHMRRKQKARRRGIE